MTFGSLFSGIGGFELGLERAGWECKWQVEIEDFCRQVLEKSFPTAKRFRDVKEVHEGMLDPVDAIVGGFPCQDLSLAGSRSGITGARSGLWSEFARIIGLLRPRIVVIENVPGLLIRDRRSDHAAMSVVVGELARLGYVGLWRCLRAAEFGASHLRKRVFIIGKLANPSSDIRGRQHFGLSGSAVPSGISAAGAKCDVANRDGELEQRGGESRGQDGSRKPRRRQHSGRGGVLADSGRAGTIYGRVQESESFDREGPSDDDRRAGGELADTQARGRRERGEPSGSDGQLDGRYQELANGSRDGCGQRGELPEGRERLSNGGGPSIPDSEREGLSNSDLDALRGPRRGDEGRGFEQLRGASVRDLADCNGIGRGLSRQPPQTQRGAIVSLGCGEVLPDFAYGPSDSRWSGLLRLYPDLAPSLPKEVKPEVCRMVDGLPDPLDGALSNRTKRLRALGNAVVPAIAEWVGRRIDAYYDEVDLGRREKAKGSPGHRESAHWQAAD